jgi:hypothetical protein
MSLLDTFRSLPNARRKLATLPRWMSGSKFQLPSGLISRRNPELLPAIAALALFFIAGFQMTLPASVALPDDVVLAPRRVPEPSQPLAASYASILARPVFAPDRAPVTVEAQPSGNLSGFEVLGTAVAGNVSTALVRDTTGRILRIKPDEILQGWRLVSIDRMQLIFDRDGERRALSVDMSGARAGRANGVRMGGGLNQVTGSSQANDDQESDNSDKDDDDDDD